MNYFDKCIQSMNVRGVYTLSLVCVSAWIVLLNTSACLNLNHPLRISELLIWLNIVWFCHLPLFAFSGRPRLITRMVTGALTTHWISFCTIISMSSGYSIFTGILVFLIALLVTLSNFRVELGDDV